MSTRYRRVEAERWAPLATSRSAGEASELRYWNKYKLWAQTEVSSSCTCCAWSPGPTRAVDGSSAVLRLASSSGLNLQIMGAPLAETRAENGFKSFKTSARTADLSYGVSWRSDGRLLACGDNSGNVYTIDANSGSILRAFTANSTTASTKPKRGTGAAVRATVWTKSSKYLASASDDSTVALWDVGAGALVWRSLPSSDRKPMRSLDSDYRQNSHHTVLAGSYNGTVYQIDFRAKHIHQLFRLDAPIESLSQNAELIAACGGTKVMVFDEIAGKRQALWRNAHAKTATVVALSTKHRILSAGLDASLRSHSLLDGGSVTISTTAQPLLALSWYMHEDIECYAIAQTDGKIITRRTPVNLTRRKRGAQPDPPKGSYRHFVRGAQTALSPKEAAEVIVIGTANKSSALANQQQPSNKRLKSYDQALRKFNYPEALDEALATRDPVIVLSVLKELNHRNALTSALSRRDEPRLEPLLAFLATHLTNPRYAPLLIQLAHTFLDLYAHSALGTVPAVDEALAKIHSLLRTEVNAQHSLLNLRGHLQALLALRPASPTAASSAAAPSAGPTTQLVAAAGVEEER